MTGGTRWQQLAIKSAIQRELIDYWDARRRANAMPSRSEIDPIDVPHLLPHLGLIDVLGGGLRFRYRLVGTQINELLGTDITGTYVDTSTEDEYRDHLVGLCRRCIDGPRIVYSESEFSLLDRRRLGIARLLLPLSRDGHRVNMILFSEVFLPSRVRGLEEAAAPFMADAVVGIRDLEYRESGLP